MIVKHKNSYDIYQSVTWQIFLIFLTHNLPVLTGCGRPKSNYRENYCLNTSYPSIGYFTSVKVITNYFVLKEKMSHHTEVGGGVGQINVTKCHQGEGSKYRIIGMAL